MDRLGGAGVLAVAVPLRALADAYQDWSCPKGSFLVGFSGYRGAWIDELAPRCASWENWATKLSGSSQPAPADWFGKPAEARARFQRDELCAGNEAVTAVRWGLATPDDEVHLQNLQIQCTNVISRIVNQQWHTELVSDNGSPGHDDHCAGAATFAYGMKIGLDGTSLTRLGLDCAASSQVFADAAVANGETIDPASLPPMAVIGQDRPGSDIPIAAGFGYGILQVANPGQCYQACGNQPGCKAWTYLKRGVRGSEPTCYLKSIVPAPKSDACCVSGVMPPTAGHSPLIKLGKLGKLVQQASPDDTQTLSATCTSTGEVCDRPAVVDLQGEVASVQVSAPASHCSPISYRLTTDNRGDLIGDTGPLAPGAGAPPMSVPRTTRQIYITATGIPGGCNKGKLGGWAVVVKLTPR